jgi:adenine phosphoribosyltransferase
MFYRINIAGLERDLKICPLNENLSIAGFVMFGDVEVTEHCAAALLFLKDTFHVNTLFFILYPVSAPAARRVTSR